MPQERHRDRHQDQYQRRHREEGEQPVELHMIVAVSENGVIGRGGDLPWHLREDLRRFKRLTMGHVMVMGRFTWESIGRPLPGRRSIVLSRDPGYRARGAEVVPSLERALEVAAEATADLPCVVFVIGGARLYEESLDRVDHLHLTTVHAEIEGDVFLEGLEWSNWRVLYGEAVAADEHNDYPTTYLHLERRSSRAIVPEKMSMKPCQ